MVAYSGLEINQDTGEISLTKLVFDFETQPTVVLQVMAYDANQTHTTYVTLKVEVEDVNDTPPLFRVEVSKYVLQKNITYLNFVF